MLMHAIVQNIFPLGQVPTWRAIVRDKDEGNSMPTQYLSRGKNILHYCLHKHEISVYTDIIYGFVSSKIYEKRDDFDFDIVNFPFLDGDVPRSTSYGVYISQLIRFAKVSSHVVDFNARNKSLTAKLLQRGYQYHKLRKTFSKFYRRHYELVSKFSVGLKTLLHQGLSEPDLVYKFTKIVGRADFSDQFRKIIARYKRIGYNINIMLQSACLVFNPITVNNFASLFNCTPVGWASDSMMAPT